MMTDEGEAKAYPWLRLLGAFLFVLAFALVVYQLLETARPSIGVISISFLVLLPMALTALLAFLADPWRARSKSQYYALSLWLMGAVILASVFILREGTICIVMLLPIWLPSSLFGAWLTWKLRHRIDEGRKYCAALVAIPVMAMTVEAGTPAPVSEQTVTRSAIIAAAPETLWPLVEGVSDVRPDEGRWNLSQSVIGLPRPTGARLKGSGLGADRLAEWENGIRFREKISGWERNRRIHWTFQFDDIEGWKMADRHLLPNSNHFRVVSGGYDLQPLAGGRTRLTIHTTYRAKTLVNGYGALWGELILGDLENNLLSVVKQRAEKVS